MSQSPSSSEAAPRLPTPSAASGTDKSGGTVSAKPSSSQVLAENAGRVGAYSSGTLTPRQSDALAFIRSFQAEKGFGPSYDEISSAMGLSAKSSASRLVHGLVQRGVLRKPYGQGRSYDLSGDRDARFHLQVVLGSFNQNGILWRNDPVVREAMRFLGWRK